MHGCSPTASPTSFGIIPILLQPIRQARGEVDLNFLEQSTLLKLYPKTPVYVGVVAHVATASDSTTHVTHVTQRAVAGLSQRSATTRALAANTEEEGRTLPTHPNQVVVD